MHTHNPEEVISEQVLEAAKQKAQELFNRSKNTKKRLQYFSSKDFPQVDYLQIEGVMFPETKEKLITIICAYEDPSVIEVQVNSSTGKIEDEEFAKSELGPNEKIVEYLNNAGLIFTFLAKLLEKERKTAKQPI